MDNKLLITALHRDYWYLVEVNKSLGTPYTDHDERGFVVRQRIHPIGSAETAPYAGLLEQSVLVNCCRKRHKVTLTDKGRLVFHDHPAGLQQLRMMKQWGSDARLGCLDTRDAWVDTMGDGGGEARKKLPKPFQEASRHRRDLINSRDRFYRHVECDLDEAWPPVSERWHSPVAVWSRKMRVGRLYDEDDAKFKFFGTHNIEVRLRKRAQKQYREMLKAGEARRRDLYEPGTWATTLRRWWVEVYRNGLHESVYLATGERAPIYSAMPIGTGTFAVLIGTGDRWSGKDPLDWGVAQWDGEQFIVSEFDTPTYKEE